MKKDEQSLLLSSSEYSVGLYKTDGKEGAIFALDQQ
jgi:hypothetical protein